MPFTLSHPAAVAAIHPLTRRAGVPLAALAIGAMVPDFEYFWHLRPRALWGHSLGGLFYFDLPVGLAAWALWETLVRDGSRALLGFPATGTRQRSWTILPLAALGILIGAATHLGWDGLTHHSRWGERLFPVLGEPVRLIAGRPMRWAWLLDHVSTVFGGVVVLTWLVRRMRHEGALQTLLRSGSRMRVFALLTTVALAAGFANGQLVKVTGYWSGEYWLARVAVGAMLAFGIGLVVFGAILRVRRGTAFA